MFQQDYIERLIEQLTSFIKKMLMLDINKEADEFIFLFEKKIKPNISKTLIDADNILSNLSKMNLNNETKDELSLIFYKAAIVYFEKKKILKARKYFIIAEKIYNYKTQTLVFSYKNNLAYELDSHRVKTKRIFSDRRL